MNEMSESGPVVVPSQVGEAYLRADSIMYVALMVAIFGGLLFFIPGVPFTLDVGRGFVFSLGVLVAFLAWLIARMKDGRFVFPKTKMFWGIGAIMGLTVLSGVFSTVPAVSFLGIGGEVGTVASVLIFCIATFLVSICFQSRKRIGYLYSGLLITAVLVFVHAVAMVFLPVSIATKLALPDHLIGSWSDIGIFFGLVLILALITFESLPLTRNVHAIFYGVFSIVLLTLAMLNFTLVWIVVGVFALIAFVYAVAFGRVKGMLSTARIPVPALVVIFLALVFSIFGDFVRDGLTNHGVALPQVIAQEGARPNWQGTVQVSASMLKKDPIFGVGPNRFAEAWVAYRPEGINTTPFFDTNFDAGVGRVPSMAVTMGFAGIVAWVLFLALFVVIGFRAMLLSLSDRVLHYLVTSGFLGALYLWVMAIFFIPTMMVMGLAFIFTGVFIGALVRAGVAKNRDFSFLVDPRVGFLSVLTLITLLVGTVSGGALVVKRFLSFVYYQNAVQASVHNDSALAEQNIGSAIRLGDVDLYQRTASQLEIARARTLTSSNDPSVAGKVSGVASTIISTAAAAVADDPSNYLNELALARAYVAVYPFLSTAERTKAHDLAIQSYEKSSELNPTSPLIPYEEATFEFALQNNDAGTKYLVEALNKKGDFVEAILLYAQVQAQNGKLADAIASTEIASRLSPQDLTILFQLGLLKYNAGDYQGASGAFESAIRANPNYANALYYLGLAYDKLGRRADATAVLERVVALNPDNAEAKAKLMAVQNEGSAPPLPPASSKKQPTDTKKR
ncbi:MAG: tetratricopeptide repeat protein [Minisyncoccota bacterium]